MKLLGVRRSRAGVGPGIFRLSPFPFAPSSFLLPSSFLKVVSLNPKRAWQKEDRQESTSGQETGIMMQRPGEKDKGCFFIGRLQQLCIKVRYWTVVLYCTEGTVQSYGKYGVRLATETHRNLSKTAIDTNPVPVMLPRMQSQDAW